MKDFICDLLRGISMIGGCVGFFLVASDAIEKVPAFLITFGSMFLYFFAEWIDDITDTEDKKEKKERKE